MFIKTFPVGSFGCNCSVLADEKTGTAIIVDPGDEGEKIITLVREKGFRVTHLIHTHAHIDHIGATKFVHQSIGGEICLHKDDTLLYDNMAMQAQVLGLEMDCNVLPVARHIEHGDAIEASADLRVSVIHTPGHTPGSVCFMLSNGGDGLKTGGETPPLLFSGDTLFLRSIGRTDLWGGDYDQIIASIRERLLTLPAETIVIPGHGPQTQIGREKMSNPFLS